LGHRFYWPELARFLQQDPIGDDINWYAYAANNPLVYTDPEGLLRWRDVEDWYMGGMGGASDWVDRKLLFGQTARYGCAATLYHEGQASGWDVAREGGKWGGALGATALGTYGLAKGGVAVATKTPAAAAAYRTRGIAGAVSRLTGGRVGLHLGRAARPIGPDIMTKTGMPRRLAGGLHQAGVKIPHVNLGRYHVIVNRYNWCKPWKWVVK
jgi:hypothetical protein